MADFPTPHLFDAHTRGTRYNFWMKLTPQKLLEGYPYGENSTILTSIVLTDVRDRQTVTDGRTGDSI